MSNKNKTTDLNKLIIIAITAIIISTIAFTSYQSRIAKQASEKAIVKVDTLEKKVDYRFFSYDGLFMTTNLVVVDVNGKVIGKLKMGADLKKIDSFYKSNPDFKKTRMYKNFKTSIID